MDLMIRRIDLFMPIRSQYGVLHYFTQKLYEALLRAGVNCRILEAEKQNPRPFLTQIFSDPPDCTLSFNGVLPDEEGRFLCEMIKIPHVCMLVDSPLQFIPLAQSPYNILACVDRGASRFFKNLQNKDSLFIPHAADHALTYSHDAERPHEVLVLASCIDYEEILANWKEQHPKALVDAILHAARITLSDQTTYFADALVQAVDSCVKKNPEIDIQTIDFITILDELEAYIIGVDRVSLIRSISDAPIDIYGNTKELWEKYVGKQSNCIVHDPLPFEEAFKKMKEAKIILNSCIVTKEGGHERIYSGMCCGAVVITNENGYMKETFEDGENVIFYTEQNLDVINNKVNDLLTNEPKRAAIAKAGSKIVHEHHTWDERVEILLKELEPLIAPFKSA
jgi:glycosyltransferase involved in cell wall biosynthesis